MKSVDLTATQVLKLCRSANSIAIAGHVNPDGDSLGSSLALAELLRSLGKSCDLLLGQDLPAPQLYAFLPGYDFIAAASYQKVPDLFIAVDSGTINRLGTAQAVFERSAQTLVIDHHANYENFADFYHGDPQAAAAGDLIWQLIRASGVAPTPTMALYCYVAILTDTGRFSFENTNSQALASAKEMVDLGVDPAFVARQIYENKPVAALQLEARLVQRMRFAQKGALVYSYVSDSDLSELKISRDATEGLPTILRSIQGVKVAALFREEKDGVRVNLRSRNGIDVGALATSFGGGGHATAAGLTLEMPLAEARDLVVPKLERLLSD